MEYILSNHRMIVLNHYLKHFVNYFSEKNERIKMALKHLGIQRIKSQTVFPYFAVPPLKNLIFLNLSFGRWFPTELRNVFLPPYQKTIPECEFLQTITGLWLTYLSF